MLELLCYTSSTFVYRFSKRNMILAGLWLSEDKPMMTSYLRPLMNEMNDLLVKGELLYTHYLAHVKS